MRNSTDNYTDPAQRLPWELLPYFPDTDYVMLNICYRQPRVQGRLAIPQDYLEKFDAAGLLSDPRKSLLGFVPQSAKEEDDL